MCAPTATYAQTTPAAQAWVDSLFSTLSTDEKIGQLFVVATYSNKSEAEYAYIERLVREQHLGGLIFMQGNPASQAQLVNRYQAAARVPLLISQDAEWGLDMRLEGTPRYPRNMTLGAIQDDSLLYELGTRIAWELRQVGVGMNFAPVFDVNNNPRNPVINDRSFGENKYNVATKGIMLARGMEDHGVLACAKHFPGHGDTDTDSHFDLPVIPHGPARLDTLELYPFLKAVQQGIGSVMVAHLYVPALDSTPDQATSLSPRVVQGLLRENLGFEGLIITDALNMHGVTKFYPPGEVALQAFLAGNDMLLFPENILLSVRMVRDAVAQGRISQQVLDERVRRILAAKYRAGAAQRTPLQTTGLAERLNSPESQALRRRLYEAATTLVQNKHSLLPLRDLEKHRIAYVQIGGASDDVFYSNLRKYADIQPFFLRKGFTDGEMEQLKRNLEGFDSVIIGVFGLNKQESSRFGVSWQTERLTRDLARDPRWSTTVVLFGSPYALRFFGEEDATIVAYETVADAQLAAAAAIFGGAAVSGRLPVSASKQFPEGSGVTLRIPVRFGFAVPEEVGLDSRKLAGIDTLARDYIAKGAMPGCQILVMREGRIVYEKAFGHTGYLSDADTIDPYMHLYDLASVTKIAATTLCTMSLVEQGVLDLDTPIGQYVPEWAGTNKAGITIRSLLQHTAGLPAWHAFHKETYADPKRHLLSRDYYSYTQQDSSDIALAPSLYGRATLPVLVWDQVRDLEVRGGERMRYSDIGMIMLGRIIETQTGKSLDRLAHELFYAPIGMSRTGFNPHARGWAEVCVPTEADTLWRHAILQGYVHDPAAAMLGGVAGHAGLFSNIYDLAKLLLMLERRGIYGDRRFLQRETVDYFTSRQLTHSRKGLGFDKPEIRGSDPGHVSAFASTATFGHTGFTGTCVWVDPAYNLIYIFLSNRTFPYASNRLLLHERVRDRIMDQIYLAMASPTTP
ncbi:MAG: glycoside hydrolase family 3 N-terminal domain-containing protein [Bacteroidia bacterium]